MHRLGVLLANCKRQIRPSWLIRGGGVALLIVLLFLVFFEERQYDAASVASVDLKLALAGFFVFLIALGTIIGLEQERKKEGSTAAVIGMLVVSALLTVSYMREAIFLYRTFQVEYSWLPPVLFLLLTVFWLFALIGRFSRRDIWRKLCWRTLFVWFFAFGSHLIYSFAPGPLLVRELYEPSVTFPVSVWATLIMFALIISTVHFHRNSYVTIVSVTGALLLLSIVAATLVDRSHYYLNDIVTINPTHKANLIDSSQAIVYSAGLSDKKGNQIAGSGFYVIDENGKQLGSSDLWSSRRYDPTGVVSSDGRKMVYQESPGSPPLISDLHNSIHLIDGVDSSLVFSNSFEWAHDLKTIAGTSIDKIHKHKYLDFYDPSFAKQTHRIQITEFGGSAASGLIMAWSENDKQVFYVGVDRRSVYCLDIDSGKISSLFVEKSGPIVTMWQANRRTLACRVDSANSTKWLTYDLARGKLARSIMMPHNIMSSEATISPDLRYVAVPSYGGRNVLVFDLTTGKKKVIKMESNESLKQLGWSNNSGRLLVGSRYGGWSGPSKHNPYYLVETNGGVHFIKDAGFVVWGPSYVGTPGG
jgi:hypothetical protein